MQKDENDKVNFQEVEICRAKRKMKTTNRTQAAIETMRPEE